MSGKFISIEGCDGSGKTTIITKLYEQLINEGYDVLVTREPGGIHISEEIRKIILNPEHTEMDDRCEALLYAAARRQHLVEKVLPAIQSGKIVLCDRFVDSSLAYQGVARGLGIDEVYKLNTFAIDTCMPDATLYLRVDIDVGLARVHARGGKDRLDAEGRAFHALVYDGYEQVLSRFPSRIRIIDANQDADKVFEDAYASVLKVITSND